MVVGDAHVFPDCLTLFFSKPPTTFLTRLCRGERRKYAGKKSRFNWGSYSQSPGHESDTLATEPSAGYKIFRYIHANKYLYERERERERYATLLT